MGTAPAPSCFISYSWDGDEHRAWVRELAVRLRKDGVDAHLDQFEARPGADLTHYMETSIRESRFVLLVCTPAFAQKANAGVGGVGYEKRIVTGELFWGTGDATKFVPILRAGSVNEALPSYLRHRLLLDFRSASALAEPVFVELLRHLYGTPEHEAPPLGERPDFLADPASRLAEAGAEVVPAQPLSWRSLRPRYFQGFDFPDRDGDELLEPLIGVWLEPRSAESDPVWSTQIHDGRYWLENRSDGRAVRYRHVGMSDANGGPRDLGETPVSVEVQIHALDETGTNPLAAAGLLYRFDAGTRDYCAFTLNADGRYSFARRTSRGYRVDFTERSDLIRPHTLNKLGIVGLGSSAELYINDQLVRIATGLERPSGETGVLALSTGRFAFDNFAIYWR